MIEKLKRNIHIRHITQPQVNTISHQLISQPLAIHSNLNKKRQMNSFFNVKKLKYIKSQSNHVQRTHYPSQTFQISTQKQTRVNPKTHDVGSIESFKIQTNIKESYSLSPNTHIKNKTGNQFLLSIRQNRKNKEKYMKIKGTKMCNTEVSPNTNRNTKWSYYSKLKRNNKVLLTEPFDQKRVQLNSFEGPCRPWSSKKYFDQNNIIF